MNIGGLGAGLSAMYPGMVQGRGNEAETVLKEMQAQQAQESQQADVLRGNALMHLFGGGQGPQPPAPGQPSTPMSPPSGSGPQMAGMGPPPGGMPGPAFATPSAPRPSPAPPQPMGPMDNQPGPVTAPQPPPGAPGPAQGGGALAPGAEPQLNGVGEQGGRPTIHGGVPNGPLTWQAIGSAIARANPGAPPQLIAKAIDRFAPMMTQESQLQWHVLKMQQDEKLVKIKEEEKNKRQGVAQEGLNTRQTLGLEQQQRLSDDRTKRTELTNENRLHINSLSTQSRELIAKLRDEGMNTRLFDTLKQKDEWKHLDADTKEKISGWIIEGQNERAAGVQEGANKRNENSVTAANQRNQTTVEGAAARNKNTTQTALEVARQRTDLAKWLADGKPITATQSRISEKGQTYDSAVSTIDQALQDVARGHKTGADVVGLKGRALGLYELSGNIGGWTDQTRRAAFEQKIATLLNTVPRLLTGSTITNKEERARMGQIIQGLTPGSTKQATVHDLVWLKEKLQSLRPALGANTNQGDIRATRPGATSAGAAAGSTEGPKPMTPAVKAAMDAAIAGGHSRADVEKMVRDKGFDPASGAEADPEMIGPK